MKSFVALPTKQHERLGTGALRRPARYAVAMETVRLAPKAEVSIYPWKDSKDHIQQAVRHVRDFLRAHHPVTAAH